MTANEGTKREKRGRGLSVPVMMRLSDCAVRFLLAAVLAGAELMGGHALFALALVGVCEPGMEGLAALVGAALGYLSFRGVVEGLRYIAAAMMIYAVSLAMGEFELYHRRWFMPAVAAAVNGVVGFVYQSAAGWGRGDVVGFATEVVLTAGTVVLYRQAFDVWEKRRPGSAPDVRQGAGLLMLCATLMMSLARVTVAGDYSLGRVLCVGAVLLCAWKGGGGFGAAAGVAAGSRVSSGTGAAAAAGSRVSSGIILSLIVGFLHQQNVFLLLPDAQDAMEDGNGQPHAAGHQVQGLPLLFGQVEIASGEHALQDGDKQVNGISVFHDASSLFIYIPRGL